jgi:hypothetical protein
MARKVWVLDTETKGTGAEMVPLDKVQEERRRSGERRKSTSFGDRPWRRMRKREPAPEPPPRRPRRFKVVDVMTRRTLAEGVGTRETLEALRGAGTVVDVRVYVWDQRAGNWRALSFGEQKLLWEHRHDAEPEVADSGLPVA